MLLMRSIEASAKTTGRDIYIVRQTVLAALYSTKGYQGLSGTLTCSQFGDCATPNVVIYQVRGLEFEPIYP
jgi:branched-chain amino acid transport system substrate-binding protein